MSILNKILTAVRGGAREVGESIVDANGTRIFEQEIRDSQEHLAKAKRDLTDVMAKQMQTKREVKRLSDSITEHEEYAGQAFYPSLVAFFDALSIYSVGRRMPRPLHGEKSMKKTMSILMGALFSIFLSIIFLAQYVAQ